MFDRPYLLLCLTFLFWAGNIVVGRAVAGEVPPIALAFWRWVLGFALLLPFVWRSLGLDLRVFLAAPGIVIALSFFGVGLFNTLLYIGLTETTAVNASLIQPLMPVVVILLSFLFFRDRIRPLQALGLVLSFTGAMLVVARGDIGVLTAFRPNIGDLWVFAGLVAYGLYAVWLRRKPAMSPLGFVAISFLLGAVMLLPAYLVELSAGFAVPLTFNAGIAVLYVAIFPSILAFLFFNRGVELVGANRVAMFFPLLPMFGSTMAVLFLGESVAWYHGAGAVLILGGIVLALRPR
ncbi:MAG: DMT family transporter [Rhodospirillaceae bacterium]|nr:DMT family transporter [Rhodospirillaceae bacterium]MBT6116446.1 DMT family transporter [Rhodospirillaceae bacterium]